MTDTTLHDPLVPADVDLRDFGFMPLHVQRLRDSDLAALSTGDEFKAAVLLWAFAWHQVPAGSLPAEDQILAARSGADKKWPRVKARALDGFVRCSDGRLYHPVIAEAALDAWERRDAFQVKQGNKETRQQRWRAELARLTALLRDAGVTPPQHATKAQLVDLCRRHGVDAPVDEKRDVRETHVDAGEVDKTGTGTGTGTGTEEKAPTELAPSAKPSPPTPPPLAFDGSNAEALNGKAVVPISAQWALPDAWGFDAEALGWNPGEVLREAEKFRQYWTAGRGANTRRSVKGWRQTWSNWLDKAAKDKR